MNRKLTGWMRIGAMGMVTGLVCLLLVGSAQAALPFTETFEDSPTGMANNVGAPWPGQHGWLSPTNTPEVQDSVAHRSVKAGAMTNASISRVISNATATDVWVDFQVQAPNRTSGQALDVSTNTDSVLFYVNHNLNLVARSNTTWVIFTGFTVDVDSWTRLTVRLNYATKKWALYAVDDAGGNAVVAPLHTNLAFHSLSTNSTITQFAVDVDGEATKGYIDNITLAAHSSYGTPLVVDSDSDSLPDRWELTYTNSLTAMDNSTDSDSDGFTDRQEWIAGTDPNDTNSYLKILTADLTAEAENHVYFDVMAGATNPNSMFAADAMGRTVVMVAAADSPGGTYVPVASAADDMSGSLSATDTLAVAEADSKFYHVTVSLGGSGVTNTEEWAMYTQERAANSKYLVSVPIDYSGTNDNLSGVLGAQALRGGQVGADTSDTNKTVLSYLNTNGDWEVYSLVDDGGGTPVWWDGAAIATNIVGPNMGFTLTMTSGGTRDRTNCVYVGRTYTSVVDIAIMTNNAVQNGNAYFAWNLIPWTRSTPSLHNGSSTDMLGFVGSGARGGITALARRGRTVTPADQLGDQIWVWENNMIWDYYWLMNGMWDGGMDDKWWNNRTGDYADIQMQPGQAYWYKHWVGSNGVNFVWSPK